VRAAPAAVTRQNSPRRSLDQPSSLLRFLPEEDHIDPSSNRTRNEQREKLRLTGRLEGLVLLLPLGVLDSVRHFCFLGVVVLKKEGERKRSKERDLMARNTEKRQGVPSEEINEVVFRGFKGRRRICC
jgi:hypothetical protein